MLNAIIKFSVHNKLVIVLCTIALVVWGSYSFTKLPIDAVPDITNNQVLVITQSPNLGATDIERFITLPIEQITRNIPGIIEQRSFSRFGLSLVTIVFSDKTDVYWARQQVSERLVQVQQTLPANMGVPTLGPVSTGLGEIFQYVIKPAKGFEQQYNLTELRSIQDWIVRKQLLGTEGVADVSSFGGLLKQYEVAVNSSKLQSMNVSVSDVFTALQNNNQNAGGAYIEKGPGVLFIRSEGLVQNMNDIGNIVVKKNGAISILIKDVGTVQIGHAVRYGATVYNNEGEVCGAIVMMLKGENSSKVIKNIKKRIAEIEKTLPKGVVIEPFLDRTKMVNKAINTVSINLLEGALIVIALLVFFLGNIRAGIIVASVIPLSLLFAVSMMQTFGISGNLMSLGALDFGLLVDGSIIIIEAILHFLVVKKAGQMLTQQQMNEVVVQQSIKIRKAASFGEIIILIVYLPILSLQGIEGKMFKPMAETVSFAILGAFILSLTYVPAMSAWWLQKNITIKKTWADAFMEWCTKKYTPLLRWSLANTYKLIIASAISFVAAIIILLNIGGEFIPELEEGDFAVDTRLLTGSSLTATIEATGKAAGILKNRFPEVEKVVTKIGSGEVPTDPMPIEASDMMVILKDKKEWTSAKTFNELANKMSIALQDVPGITTGFQYPVQMRFNELMTGARQDVVIKIFGDDLQILSKYAAKVANIANTISGATDMYVETVTGVPQVVIQYNRAALARYGINIVDVNNTVQAAYAGAISGALYEGEKKFDIAVRLQSNQKNNVADIENLLVALPNGNQIPLGNIASIQIQDGPYQIQHENARRRITVGFNVRDRDVQSVVKELQEKINKKVQLPPAYEITYGGEYENLQTATNRLLIAVPAALLLILVLLYFAFNHIKYALLIFAAIPLSAIGGVMALWLRGMPFSISAGVGFIALFGVSVLNGIVLIDEMNRIKNTATTNLQQIIIQATTTRLRPVFITALVASLGFLPMAISNGAGAEVQKPLATVVIGGLLTATVLTLIILPCLYQLIETKLIKKNK
jgi:heavy metal efflux system protein